MYAPSLSKRLLRPFISPDQFDFWARELGTLQAWERCFAKVVDRRDEARDTVSLTLKPNANFPGYTPGQHMNLSATIKGRRLTRSYSFTSIPDKRGLISLTVRRDRHGTMSRWLCDTAGLGTILEISGVFGDMTLDSAGGNSEDELLLLAAGSGITPFLSLIKQRRAHADRANTTLLYWESSMEHFCFGEELDQFAQQDPSFTVHRITTRPSESAGDLSGRIDARQLETLLGKPGDKSRLPVALICGGNGFTETARSLIQGYVRLCRTEAFTPPQVSDTEGAESLVSIELTQSRRTITVSNRKSLLTALEEHGIPVRSGCRMGICNTCVCAETRGITQDISSAQIHRDGAIKLCVSQAKSNLKLDL